MTPNVSKPSIDIKTAYYAFAVTLMSLFTYACLLAGDNNLPPQKPVGRFIINLIFAHVILVYLWLFRSKENFRISRWAWILLIYAGLILCSMAPIFSGDLHEYLMRGRIFGVYHDHPYLTPRFYPNDFFYTLTVWVGMHKLPENYGPLWVLIQWIAPTLFKNSYVLTVFFFKLILFGFLAGSVLIFHKIAFRLDPKNAVWLTAFFALNPNLISHILIDGHNDIVMVFLMLAAFYAAAKEKHYWAVAWGSLAVLIKFTSVILLPVLAIMAYRDPRFGTLRQKAVYSSKAFGIFIFTVAAFYIPFWVGAGTFEYFSKFHEWFATNSVPYAIHALLGRLGLHIAEEPFKRFFMLFFAVNCAAALMWLFRKKNLSVRDGACATAWMFLAMYASYTIPFYGHHLLWAFPFMLLAEWPAPLLWTTLYTGVGVYFYFKRPSVLFVLAFVIYSGYLLSAHFLHKTRKEAL